MSVGLTSLRFGRLLELHHFALEVGEILEALVHRREPQVRDVIEAAQALEHGDADAVAPDLAAFGAQLLLDLAGERRRWRARRAGRSRRARGRCGASRGRTARGSRPACATMTPCSSSRSYVVNRRPQARHSRRRRIAAPSSPARESTTLSSFSRQNGQRTVATVSPSDRGISRLRGPSLRSVGLCTRAQMRIFANGP